MADVNKIDLKQFMLWYSQAGTPTIKVTSRYDAKAKSLRLKVSQSTPPTPGQKTKKPLHIPLAIGLLDERGRNMMDTEILSVTKAKQEFVIDDVRSRPVLSLLRDFSAPVRLDYPYTDDELLFLLAKDGDAFCRWEAGNKLLTKYLLQRASGAKIDENAAQKLMSAFGQLLLNKHLDAAFKSMALALPSEGELGLTLAADKQLIDPDALYAARRDLTIMASRALSSEFETTCRSFAKLSATATDGVSMGKRSLKNLCLYYRAAERDEAILHDIHKQATTSRNMTDQVAALGILAETSSPWRDKALAAFDKKWRGQPTIMDKWLAVQASGKHKDVLRDVKVLMQHPAYDAKNPNRISALIGAFAGNVLGFHAKDGSGYRFIADQIVAIDAINPHSAARLCKAFARWRDYDAGRQSMMRQELERLAGSRKLSANSSEIVTKSLAPQ
jgi:aminopeptidase N